MGREDVIKSEISEFGHDIGDNPQNVKYTNEADCKKFLMDMQFIQGRKEIIAKIIEKSVDLEVEEQIVTEIYPTLSPKVVEILQRSVPEANL
jgi:hypothetical protein